MRLDVKGLEPLEMPWQEVGGGTKEVPTQTARSGPGCSHRGHLSWAGRLCPECWEEGWSVPISFC